MGKIDRFEELEAWRRARELTKAVYDATRVGEFARDFALRDQIRRAVVSVISNIAEGFERDGNAEFRQFLTNAKGSCGEVKAQLYVALDAGYLAEKDCTCLVRSGGPRVQPDRWPYAVSCQQ